MSRELSHGWCELNSGLLLVLLLLLLLLGCLLILLAHLHPRSLACSLLVAGCCCFGSAFVVFVGGWRNRLCSSSFFLSSFFLPFCASQFLLLLLPFCLFCLPSKQKEKKKSKPVQRICNAVGRFSRQRQTHTRTPIFAFDGVWSGCASVSSKF